MSKGFFGGGNGTVNSPFLIEDADDLNAIRYHNDKCFKLVNDINLGNGKYNSGQGWIPIEYFSGSIEGNWHKIINLTINRPQQDYVAFLGNVINANIQRLFFVDANVIGHNDVAIVARYVGTATRKELRKSWPTNENNRNINNIYVINSFVKGNTNVRGMFGYTDGMESTLQFYNLYSDVTIQSNDKIAYGIAQMWYGITTTIYDSDQKYPPGNSTNNCGHCNCACNCNCACACACACNQNGTTQFLNCVVQLHKDSSIVTYYGICDKSDCTYNNCYVDNTEISPIIYGNTQYADLSNVKYETDILPVLSKQYFAFEPTKTVKPKNLNLDSIYFQLTDGYYVYDFSSKKFIKKYTELTNTNSKKIIQNGMNRFDLKRIPSDAIKYLSDNYKTIKIVDCIIAHEKLIFNTINYKGILIKSEENKNFIKTKIKFSDVNDKIVTLKSI